MIYWNRQEVPKEFEDLQSRKRTLNAIDAWLALPAHARKGKLPPTRSRLDQDKRLEELLRAAFHNKCAYCELPLQNDRAAIANYRPRWRTTHLTNASLDHQRYFWLMWEWSNLLLLCRECSRHKETFFPLDEARGGRHARIGESDPHLLCWERPLLLDPGTDNPNHHLRFDEEGGLEGITERGRATVAILKLNDWEGWHSPCQRRKEQAKQLKERFERACRHKPDATNATTISQQVAQLLAECAQSAPFAGMKRQLLMRWLERWMAEQPAEELAEAGWKRLHETLTMWMTTPEHSIYDQPERTLRENQPRQLILRRSAPPSPGAPRKTSHRWAFLVGINEYACEHIRPLRGCHNDVKQLGNQLRSLGYQVTEVLDHPTDKEQPLTRESVQQQLQTLCETIPEDALLFTHFSCHGEREGDNRYLLMPDTVSANLAETALPLTVVTDLMAKSSARQLLLTLDACRMGMNTRGASERQDFVEHVYELASGFAILAASTADQWAYEQEGEDSDHALTPPLDYNHGELAVGGVFTHYLVQGLRGVGEAKTRDEIVTVDSLKDFILDRLRSWQEQNHHHKRQVPTVRIEGMGSILLADYRLKNKLSILSD